MRLRLAIAVAAVAGFVGLSYEVLWYRAISYVTDSAPWAFGALLGAYLLGVAAASLATRVFCERHPRPRPRDVLVAAAFTAVANAAGFAVVPAMASLARAGRWELALPLLAVAAGLLGAVLPLCAHLAIPADARAGARLSYVYLADIVGSALGSAVTGYVLLDVLTTRAVSVLLAVVGFALAAGLVAAAELPRRAVAAVALAATGLAATASAAAPVLFDRLWERLQWRERDRGERFATVVENRHGIVAVTADQVVYGGSAYDGVISLDPVNDRNFILRAYAVTTLRPGARRILLVGLGSGAWARVMASLPGVEQLVAVEINPGYLEVIRSHPDVAPLLDDPRVQIVIDDGRRWLARHPEERFDAIVANVTLHWRASSTNLLSREFVELVKRHLTPNGVYFFNTTFFVPARQTALEVFGHGRQVGTFFAASDAPVPFDLDRLRATLAAVRFGDRPAVALERPQDRAWLASLSVGAPAYRRAERMSVITDDNMLPEFRGSPYDPAPIRPLTAGTR